MLQCSRSLRSVLQQRHFLTLAIESSCDDTSVALIETHQQHGKTLRATLLHHVRHTSDNRVYGGIHPIVAHVSHQANLAPLLHTALLQFPRRPDLVAVTRGPGMRGPLTTGLDTAKGLSMAWGIPLVGVNHMQAHALTPRLLSAMAMDGQEGTPTHKSLEFETASVSAGFPDFPFLTLLVSGGHTMLLYSRALCSHRELTNTIDIALGDYIDKLARDVLPPSTVEVSASAAPGALLEAFAFPNGPSDYQLDVLPSSKSRATQMTQWGWGLGPPLAQEPAGVRFSFAGIGSLARKIAETRQEMGLEERMALAKEGMRVAFEHVALAVVAALKQFRGRGEAITALVVSGGVASNGYLRHILSAILHANNFDSVTILIPPKEYCTDNAAMVAWAGVEMWSAGWESELRCRALRKWGLDPEGDDGGILGVDGWRRRDGFEE